MHDSPLPPAGALGRYGAGAIILHWTIALLVAVNIAIGLRMEAQTGLAKFQAFQLHKSVGITVLLLSLARLAWRLTHRPPPLPAHMKPWERRAAGITHWAFYALLIGLPLTGWIVVSASPFNLPTLLYKVIPWPHIGFIHALPAGARKSVAATFAPTHVVLAWTAITLLILHIGAALRHQFWTRDGVLWRMAPMKLFQPARPEPEI